MPENRRAMSYIDDSDCVQVFDPMMTYQEVEEKLDEDWMQKMQSQRTETKSDTGKRAG